jgi:uncharacterized ion transporter superfamily protein YfcC|tara:strand:+ start:5849 stop:7228 length:1380 start_codon:yes stop_codon:yes gene_type:complete
MRSLKFPSAYTVLFILIAAVALATWLVPAGQYQRQFDEALGRDIPIANTYQQVDPNPQGLVEIFLAPVQGFEGAVDVSLFVLLIGGFLGVVSKTGAINAGIGRTMKALKGHEIWMIPILMALFAAGGTIYGMAEETIPFYVILIPVMMAAGYDSITAVAIILIGAGIGTLGSTVNPFATVIASDAAGVAFTQGLTGRLLILGLGWLASVGYVMWYAARIKADAKRSLVADQADADRRHFLKGADPEAPVTFTAKHKLILLIFAGAFATMIWGVSSAGWWMEEMGALFIFSALLVGLVDRMNEQEFTTTFVDGARELLGVALVIGIARGIVWIMNQGMITDTVLFWSANALQGLSEIAFINVIYWLQVGLSFLVPSSSGLAVLTMPIMAPLADFSGVGRELVVTAYQSASGLVNFITPTSGVVMGALAIGRISYARWLRFIWPLLLLLTGVITAVLSLSA